MGVVYGSAKTTKVGQGYKKFPSWKKQISVRGNTYQLTPQNAKFLLSLGLRLRKPS